MNGLGFKGKLICNTISYQLLDTEDASETDMAKLEEEFTEMKEQ